MVTVVTGAAGMLGSATARRLIADGHDVVGIDLRPIEDSTGRGYRHLVGDVRDVEPLRRALRGADVLVHCAAALPSYPPDEVRSIVVDGTRAVLTAARAAGVHRVVHISSTAVYGLPKTVPTPEQHPSEPVDVYSRAKVSAEAVCEEFRAAGMCVPVLRPKTFLGPGRMGLFAMLFEWADEGRNFPVIGRGDVRIQMLSVNDLVDAVLAAMTAPDEAANNTFNIAAADFGTLREDFQAVLDAAGHGRRIVSLPVGPALAVLGALERTGLSPVYGRLLHKLRADSYVDIGKAGQLLGFAPKYSNRDAILSTYHWWRERPRRNGRPAGGRTSRDPWRQGALSAAKIFF